MRIAQVAPLAESVPPKLYGGTERVVSWLTEDLVALRHEVTLFASGDSVTNAHLVPVWPRSLRMSKPRGDPIIAVTTMLEAVARRAADFDVIHVHIDWLHVPLLRRLRTPFVTTLHGRLDLPGLSELLRDFPDAALISISHDQRTSLPAVKWAGTIYHGMPPTLLQPRREREGYLAFLGRLAPEKGADRAIRIARRVNIPLRIAAKLPREASQYYKDKIQPELDGRLVQFIGEVRDEDKEEFLGNAAAMLFPIDWPEPFGLVMIEAMACGTPVIAFRRGSVPEVIEDNVSGLIVEDEAGAIIAVGRIQDLDRDRVRDAFERRFTTRRMTEDYLTVYQRLIETGAQRP